MNSKRVWVIEIGGGYGEFLFEGTETEAEEMRAAKARWEGAIGRKRLANSEDAERLKGAYGYLLPAAHNERIAKEGSEG